VQPARAARKTASRQNLRSDGKRVIPMSVTDAAL
jgi:hypothetical protein